MTRIATPGVGGTTTRGAADAARGWWREAVRISRGVLGADRYERYLAHHYGTGCASPALTEREFWRRLADAQDARPESRCC